MPGSLPAHQRLEILERVAQRRLVGDDAGHGREVGQDARDEPIRCLADQQRATLLAGPVGAELARRFIEECAVEMSARPQQEHERRTGAADALLESGIEIGVFDQIAAGMVDDAPHAFVGSRRDDGDIAHQPLDDRGYERAEGTHERAERGWVVAVGGQKNESGKHCRLALTRTGDLQSLLVRGARHPPEREKSLTCTRMYPICSRRGAPAGMLMGRGEIDGAADARLRGGKRAITAAAPAVVSAAAFESAVPDTARRRGRGTLTNRAGRFEPRERIEVDDGWNVLETLPAFATTVAIERPKTVITRNESPDLSFDRSINPYRGCEHGCVYCFARPSHAYLGLSPGLDFETRLTVKLGAAERLEAELAAPGYRPRTIAIGTNTDPYQPIERQHAVMRGLLEVLSRCRHPVGIVTKSALVVRDIDLLAPMAAQGLVKVAISVTTLDADLARTMEPRATTPARRLDAIGRLAAAGIPVTVMVAPIIPAVNDAEIETILARAYDLGAREAGFVMLRLPLEVRDLFKEWLLAHFPDRFRHVMSLVQSIREGKENDSTWGRRMTGTGPYALMIRRRFEVACERLGFARTRARLRNDLFVPPVPQGGQLDLFG